VTDERVALGHSIFALHDPNRGYEVAFNRYYERDHAYAAGMAPYTLALQRWVATRELKDLRYPAEGPFGQPLDAGSFLAMYWIQAGHLEDQQLWVSEFNQVLTAHGRTFDERTVQTATTYDYVGGAFADPDGVPPEQALEHRFPGVVWTWIERDPGTSLDEMRQWLLEEHLPATFAGAPVAMTLAFTPLPKADWWPAAAPEVPGVGDRLILVHFLEVDPRDCWADHFAGLGASIDASGKARTLFVAPFIPTVPGTDRYCDELW
jgi:hypothetical protein